MPTHTDLPLSPAERRRQVASILAKGVIRLRRRASPVAINAAQESPDVGETGLELSRETRLTVGTRGSTPRDDGDNV